MESSDILWALAIGALFFMMIRRGGCCGGHRHKDKTGKGSDAESQKTSPLPLEIPPEDGDFNNPTHKRSRT